MEDRPWQPCPSCGVADAVMRDPVTLMPRYPPPLEPVAMECLICVALAEATDELSEAYGMKGKLPPGVRMTLRPWKKPEEG